MGAAAGVGMAANVVGGAIQAIAAEQAARSMRNTFQDEITRQQAFRHQAYQQWEPFAMQSGAETANQQIQQGQDQRLQNYAQLRGQPLGVNSPTQSFVYGAGDRGVANLTGQAKSKIGGYSDWQFKQGLGEQKLAQGLGKITNFAGGQAAILPLRMYDAEHSADTLAKIGALISSIGGGAANFASQFAAQPPSQGGTSGSFGHGSVWSGPANSDATYNTIPGWKELPAQQTNFDPSLWA